MDTSIWEARADCGQAAKHQSHRWPSLLVFSLIWVPARFLLPPTCLASHDLWGHPNSQPFWDCMFPGESSQTCCSSPVPGHL